MPTISVVIPAYNAARYIREAIDSLLQQTLPPSEIIVVDDGSTDQTSDILKEYGTAIRYFRQANAGGSAARNNALSHASGHYVALLDADDIAMPHRFERQVEAFRSAPSAIACFTGYFKFAASGRLSVHEATAVGIGTGSLDFLSRCLFHIPSLMFVRERATGLRFPEDVQSGEDIVFSAMLAARGAIVSVGEPLYGYRSHPQQISRTFQANVTSNRFFEDRYNWAKKHWREHWPEKTWDDIEQSLWTGLARQTEENYWARHKQFFLNDRAYMRRRWPAGLARPAVLGWRWYPEAAWRFKRELDKITGLLQRRTMHDRGGL